mgnify:CR=1 FL=1
MKALLLVAMLASMIVERPSRPEMETALKTMQEKSDTVTYLSAYKDKEGNIIVTKINGYKCTPIKL